ncbi:hypothetical protein B0H63DRAFT_246813 [Podospora didyma]|uniref:Heme oxygenase n=1 Tax=Podospora didyma TaxID=330526 RepID=A0AAE0KL00_9PEZI|nr:hypothetical protein B0H63DRAFT_246813 [Podospora didyma]
MQQQEPPHLGERINIATRSSHTKLNKQILLRLPLAVPPRAHTPSAYVSGLLHVAPIYFTFESLWQGFLLTHEKAVREKETKIVNGHCGPEGCLFANGKDDGDGNLGQPPPISDRIYSVLNQLRILGLARSSSLLQDIRSITGWSEDVVDEEIEAVVNTGRLREFVAHAKRSIEKHPHVLLAYSWVFYMALFSGGRFIRGSLEAAGHEFWSKTADPIQPSGRACEPPIPAPQQKHRVPEEPVTHTSPGNADGCASLAPLQFFRFATPQDGEDLKTAFKTRLLESETLLTPSEIDNVVQEAICIFDNLNSLISQLDTVFENGSPSGSFDGWASFLMPRIGGRLRDSVTVTRERSLKALSRATAMGRGSGRSSSGSSAQPDSEKKRRLSGHSTTGTNSSHAHGMLTPSAELVERTGLVPVNGHPKVVHFGDNKTPVKLDNREQLLSASGDGSEPGLEPTRREVAEVPAAKRKSVSFASMAIVWNIALLLGVTAVFCGFAAAHARR